jgi:hypothetical protein
LGSIEDEKLLTKSLKIEGNWMVSDVQITAAEEITKILCEIDPQNKSSLVFLFFAYYNRNTFLLFS